MKLLILTQKVDKNDDVLGFMHGWIAEFAKHCEKVTVIALGVGEFDLPRNVTVLSLGKDKTVGFSGLDAEKMGNKFDDHLETGFPSGDSHLDATRPSGGDRLKYVFNFYKYIWQERNNYDNVFVHMNQVYVILGGLLWHLWGKKIGLWYMHKSVDLKLRIAEKLTHTIFSATPESFRLKTKKLNVTGHGIPSEKFVKSKIYKFDGQFKIITIGRISPIKDYETLIDAVKLLKNDNLEVHLDIVGGIGRSDQNNYLENLKQKVKDENLEGNINFIGAVPNREIIDYLHSADLFVNTSQTGSLDKAILEAMSCGLLVLSSNDSSRKVFGGYQDKLFFKAKDSLDLSKKILELSRLSDSKKDKIGSRLRTIVEEDHNLRNLIVKILNVYRK